MSKIICGICPHQCALDKGQIGLCRARSNVGEYITAINYGLLTSINLDPIDKKPLYRFFPGSMILSVGSFGCNFYCPFCQNHQISMSDSHNAKTRSVTPDELIKLALSLRSRGNIGIAYTYNEPLIGYEYVRDCAEAAKKEGLKNVVVSNGYICEKPLKEILPLIDAFNIDLKSFNEDLYRKIGGGVETVKRTIELASEFSHVEVTTLIIPNENDSEQEIINIASWLAKVSPNIPLHLTRFFPQYKMQNREATPVKKIHRLADIAREYLKYVYVGNC